MTRAARPAPWALAIIAVVFTAACFVDPGPFSEPSATPSVSVPSQAVPSQTVPGQQEDGTMTVEEFEDDLRAAVTVAEKYWSAQFQDSGQQFTPIRGLVPYERANEVACGNEGVPANNALYCPAGDFIAYDADWAVAAFQKIGDAFLFYLLGHEYAHGIQQRLGISFQHTIDMELQADCMSGAYIGDSVRAKALNLQDGDLQELRDGLAAVGDDPDQPWFAPGAHGTAEQRTRAFFAGYENSLAACDL